MLAEPVLEDDLAAFCWRRAVTLDPKSQDSIFREAAERLAPGYVLEHVVEQNPASLLRFAEVIDDPLIRTLTSERLKALLITGKSTSRGEDWMQLGRLEALQGQNKEASDHFREAVRLEPLLWEYRLRYAEALAAQGELQLAQEQLQAGLRVAPEQPKLKALQQELLQRERKSRQP
jgi:predicted Zn-dependent protease